MAQCSNQIYRSYINFKLEYASVTVKNTFFLETICLHITDSRVIKSVVSDIITTENTDLTLFDAQENLPSDLISELYRIIRNFLSYGGKRMFFFITPLDNLITLTEEEDTISNVVTYIKANANSLATVATLEGTKGNFITIFSEFAALYEKTTDKTTPNTIPNVCKFYDLDIGYMPDYLQFLSTTYSYSGDDFLNQKIIFRRHAIENHDNVISSVDDSTNMRRNLLSFISCDSEGGFVGNFTVGAMNDTHTFWVAQVKYDIEMALLGLIKKPLFYNALSIKENVSNNCLMVVYNITIQVLERYKTIGRIRQYYSVVVPDQTEENRQAGVIDNVSIAYDGVNIVTAINGNIKTDITLLTSSQSTTTTTEASAFVFSIPEGAKQESWRKGSQESSEGEMAPHQIPYSKPVGTLTNNLI
jgi:hypothetical protein